MSDELLEYYNQELAFLRKMGAEFARAHPKVAGRIRLGADTVEDPHVARLVESTAFLSARIRRKIDDDFPEISDALLGVLYPHYQAPIPSLAIVQMEPPKDLAAPQLVPRGVAIETDRAHGEPCRYRTCYPTVLHGLAPSGCSLVGVPFEAPRTPRAGEAKALLRLTLRARGTAAPLRELTPPTLRFYLGGQTPHAMALYELLTNDVLEVALALGPDDARPQVLPADCIRPVGFGADEGLLPYSPRSFLGYRLLSEYFAFPQKFLFLDVHGIQGQVLDRAKEKIELFFYLRRSSVELQRHLGPESFACGCTPMVNLFPKRAEPVRLTQREPEVRLVPDARRAQAFEVYSVERVNVAASDGKQRDVRPFYGFDHGPRAEESKAIFFHAARRAAENVAGRVDAGTEVYLQFVDLHFDPALPADHVLTAELLCTNRDLPSRLPFGVDQPRLALADGEVPLEKLRCLTPPTPTRRASLGHGARWRLLSHLALNHLSLTSDAEGLRALKELLRLYDCLGSESSLAVVDSLLGVASGPATMRVSAGLQMAFAHGTEVRLHLDESRFADKGLYLFASVLERFLALYSTVNGFVRLAVTTNQREGVAYRWPPRTGTRALL
ncbi:MAG: type VI secretion system baseplate subunit TssF [Planctomycetes bacterium]|nr:type VI secretion system baseplate subunit TssF [Planctomycetota bacterium]